MRKGFIRLFVLSGLLILGVAGCKKTKEAPKDERLDECVVIEIPAESVSYSTFAVMPSAVMENAATISGTDLWEQFLTDTQEEDSASIRIAYHFTDEQNDGADEATLIFDLFYQDGAYTLSCQDGETEHTDHYAALRCFDGEYRSKEWYLLSESMADAEYYKVSHVGFSSNLEDAARLLYFTE